MSVFSLISWLLWCPVAMTGAYLLVFSLLGLRRRKFPPEGSLAEPLPRVAVLVPAYKEDAVILETAERLLEIAYPTDRWDLVIIGDHLQTATIFQLKQMPLRLVSLQLADSTKAKALNAALDELEGEYELAMVLDADNLVQPQVLHEFAAAYQAGARVIQARRVAKNQNSPMAMLDAISEEVNNHIFCQGHRVVGLSSRLIGSGMAFEFALFKQFMANNHAVGGFDKELELTLMQAGEVIEYLPETYIYDEKVSKTAHFKRQRLRWISAQYHYLGRFFRPAIQALFSGQRLSFVDKTFQLLLLPRLVLIGLAALGAMGSLLLGGSLVFAWLLALVMVVLAYALATPRRFYRKQTLKALLLLPKAFLQLIWELRGLRTANKKFIHTPHGEEKASV